MNNIEEDYKLFQLVKRNPIKNCIDLSKNMIGKRNGLIYFTESFRIDFENKMCDLERLKAEHEEDKKKIEEMKCDFERVKINMQKDIDNAKKIRFEEFQELKKENQNLKNENKLYEFEIKSIKNQNEAAIKGLKETIVMMATASYNAQESFFQTLKNIDKKLNLIIDWRNKNND